MLLPRPRWSAKTTVRLKFRTSTCHCRLATRHTLTTTTPTTLVACPHSHRTTTLRTLLLSRCPDLTLTTKTTSMVNVWQRNLAPARLSLPHRHHLSFRMSRHRQRRTTRHSRRHLIRHVCGLSTFTTACNYPHCTTCHCNTSRHLRSLLSSLQRTANSHTFRLNTAV